MQLVFECNTGKKIEKNQKRKPQDFEIDFLDQFEQKTNFINCNSR